MRPLQSILVFVTFFTSGLVWGAADDADSPKGAMKTLYRALEAGDAATIRSLFATSSESESQLADGFVKQMMAAKAMTDAMKAKYATSGEGLTKGMPARETIVRLEKASQDIQGDRATVTIPGQTRPVRLVKTGGRWKISLADFAGADAQNMAAQISVLNDLAQAYQSITADIQADKFATIQEAQRALGQKLQRVMLDTLHKNPPGTGPATNPSTAPATAPSANRP